jgi:hypothetical protein
MSLLPASELKRRHRETRGAQPEALRVRIHRAISWLARAEAEADDPDAQFLFLWIALNAAYASEFGFEVSERDQARTFLASLLTVDTYGLLHAALFRQFTGPIRTLIDNKFVFEPFWKAMREHDSSDRWQEQFAASRKLALRAVMEQQTDTLLGIVLDRLYVLRNQLVHGGSTWNSSTNRAQVNDGAHILRSLVPIVLELMMRWSRQDQPGLAYPPIPG